MVLSVQLIALFYSFLYGIFFEFVMELGSRFLNSKLLFLKIISSFLFVLFLSLLYFFILMKINYGYIHVYFFLCIYAGVWVCKVIKKRFVK